MKAAEFEVSLFEVLERLDEETSLIPKNVNIYYDSGIYISCRRGTATHNINIRVSKDVNNHNTDLVQGGGSLK